MMRAQALGIQEQLIGETATWMHTPLGEMLSQFRTFPLVAMEKQTAREWRMMDTETAQIFMYGAAVGSMMYFTRLASKTIGMDERSRNEYLDKYLTPSAI